MERIMNLNAQEVFELLEKAGMNPQWCNTPVPYFDASVQAGVPTDPGDIPFGEQLLMAEDMVKGGLTFCINVSGYSMKDANIVHGDRVELLTGVPVRDGDIVIAEIDKEYTLKSYLTDEQGNKWLVPANPDFKPFMLNEDMNVRILGKVMRVFKEVPHIPYAELMRCVKEVRDELPSQKEITAERVEAVIREMGDVVKQVRQWYAVFRPMVDAEVLCEDDYEAFVQKVCFLLPTHKRLPVASELRRMCVQSFRKSAEYWKSNDAPVSGYRFDAYLRIARLTAEKLRK